MKKKIIYIGVAIIVLLAILLLTKGPFSYKYYASKAYKKMESGNYVMFSTLDSPLCGRMVVFRKGWFPIKVMEKGMCETNEEGFRVEGNWIYISTDTCGQDSFKKNIITGMEEGELKCGI